MKNETKSGCFVLVKIEINLLSGLVYIVCFFVFTRLFSFPPQ